MKALSPMDRKYMAEDDLRTLSRASEITADKVRMAGVSKELKRQVRGLKRVSSSIGGRGTSGGRGKIIGRRVR